MSPSEWGEQVISDLELAHVLQDCVTLHHTNPLVPAQRVYRYTIYESELLPWPVKLIERMERADG